MQVCSYPVRAACSYRRCTLAALHLATGVAANMRQADEQWRADDAGATEVAFLLDEHTYGTDSILGEPAVTPALAVEPDVKAGAALHRLLAWRACLSAPASKLCSSDP